MHLRALDWIIVVLSLGVSFVPAIVLARRAGKNITEFFAAGRQAPWWLIGISLVATTFSTDTPNLVTNLVRDGGVSENWVWWSFLLTGMATVFFYARLWRRSGVLTDLEFYELRYAGRAASFVRGFRAIYLGLFFNCWIIATVNLALVKIAGVLFGWPRAETLAICVAVPIIFAATAGLWGVMVTDMIQFCITMTSAFAAAYFAIHAPGVGGLHGLIAHFSGHTAALSILPNFGDWKAALAVFVIPMTVLWWSVWYPGAEPGGGSYVAQRMLAARTESDALFGTFVFQAMDRRGACLHDRLSHAARRADALPGARTQPHRQRCRLSRDARLLADRLCRLHGRRNLRGLSLDDRNAPQLGHVVSRTRFLPALHCAGFEPARAGLRGAAGDGASDGARRRADLRARSAREPASSTCCDGFGGGSTLGAK